MTSLTTLQLAVLRVLWERGEATIADVQQALRAGRRRLAQTTVATLLLRLEKRRIVAHRVEGRQFVYRALVEQGDVRRSMVGELTASLFGGDAAELIGHLLTSRDIDRGDLAKVKAMLAEHERGAKKRTRSER